MRFGLLTSLVTAVVSLGHVYLYLRLFRDTGAARWVRALGIAALVLLGPGFIAVRQFLWPLPWPWGGIFTAAQWLWVITALYLMGFFALADAGRALRRRAPEPSVERRRFVAGVTAGAAGIATASSIGYGFWSAYASAPRIHELAVRVPHLPRSLSGFTIVQVTDVHVGALIQRRFVEELVSRVNGLRPDLVAITGDLVDAMPRQIGHAVAALGNLRAREGTFFVTGNHEYHSDEALWCEALEGLGIHVLRNRAVRIGDGEDSFDLLGVDDWGGARRRRQGYDLDRALEGLRPERARVLLAHQPKGFEAAADRGVGLQISGHTHGGQVFPMTQLIRLQWPQHAGLYSGPESHLFVSRGAGFWGPPLRLGSPPEIAKIVLL